MAASRGCARTLARILEQLAVPAVVVDNHRRHVEANPAARLLFRLSLAQLHERRIDDLTPAHLIHAMHAAWERLLQDGHVAGTHHVALDGSSMRIFYSAIANILPARHAIVFVPADWSDAELGTGGAESQAVAGETLSAREIEVLGLVAVGDTAGEIADRLSISATTVSTHMGNIRRKLGARNAAHAVALAMDAGLVELSSVPPPADEG